MQVERVPLQEERHRVLSSLVVVVLVCFLARACVRVLFSRVRVGAVLGFVLLLHWCL